MTKNRLFLPTLALVALVSFASCKKEEKDNPKPTLQENEVEVKATDYGKWIYFSFEQNKTVGESGIKETKEGLDWDIAFNRYNIRLNGGTSGKGQAAAKLVEGKKAKSGWDAVVKAPNDGYQVDDSISVMVGHEMPPKFMKITGNKIITGGKKGTWVTMSGMPPTYETTNQIFVLKTAKGNYAKIWLKQYVGADKKGGHIVMKYVSTKEGSTKFE